MGSAHGRDVGNQDGKNPAETTVPSHLVSSLQRSLRQGGCSPQGEALSSDGGTSVCGRKLGLHKHGLTLERASL